MEKILLVDDEQDALEVLEWVLSDYGCDVRSASSGENALTVAQAFRPSVVITDYCLRGELTGLDLIRALRRRSPALKAILMTGMPADTMRAELGELDDVVILSKPFRWSELHRVLELEWRVSGVIKTAAPPFAKRCVG